MQILPGTRYDVHEHGDSDGYVASQLHWIYHAVAFAPAHLLPEAASVIRFTSGACARQSVEQYELLQDQKADLLGLAPADNADTIAAKQLLFLATELDLYNTEINEIPELTCTVQLAAPNKLSQYEL